MGAIRQWLFGQKRALSPAARETIAGYLFLAPWIVGFLVFTGGSMGASLVISLLKTDFLTHSSFVGLSQYQGLWNDPLVGKALWNTSYYAVSMVPLATGIGLVLAVLLNQGIRFQGFWRTVYYVPSVVSGVAVALLWGWLLNPRLGLVNSLLECVGIRGPEWFYSETWAMPAMIIMSLWGSGGSMLIYLGGLRSIPTVLYEAAKIDGANSLQRFWKITIPMLTPTIFFTMVMNAIVSFQIFTPTFVLTQGGPNNATLTMVLFLYRKGFEQFRFGYASAVAWLMFGVIVSFTLLVIRSSEFWVFYAGSEG